jgi:hypothetical protein
VEVKLGEGEEGEAKKFDCALPNAASALKYLTEVSRFLRMSVREISETVCFQTNYYRPHSLLR